MKRFTKAFIIVMVISLFGFWCTHSGYRATLSGITLPSFEDFNLPWHKGQGISLEWEFEGQGAFPTFETENEAMASPVTLDADGTWSPVFKTSNFLDKDGKTKIHRLYITRLSNSDGEDDGFVNWEVLDNQDMICPDVPMSEGTTLYRIDFYTGAFGGLLPFLASHHVSYFTVVQS